MSYEEMAKDLKKFVTEQGLEKFTLSGICIGARVAMKFAGMYPEMVDALVVIEGSVGEFDLPYVHEMVDFMTLHEGKPSSEFDKLIEEAFPGGEGQGKYSHEIDAPAIKGWVRWLLDLEKPETIQWRSNWPVIKA